MGLYRYLRRKLNTQQLRETCESTHEMVDKCLKEMCSGDGVNSKLNQALQNDQQLKEISEGISSKSDQSIAVQHQLREIGNVVSLKLDQSIAVQQQILGIAESAQTKADQVIQSQQQLKETACSISSKFEQAIAVQQKIKETGEIAKTKLDQISTNIQQFSDEIEFSRRSRSLFAGFRYWEENFYNAIKGNDIGERYDRLIDGLSDEDVRLIQSMIGRIQHLFENGDTTCYLPDESERIYCNQKESLSIVKLSDHCFVYKNFKLPVNVFEISTFVSNYGLDLVDHPEYADGKDIIDAGAYIGDSALVFDRFFSKCRRVYAFEPDTESYGLMEKTIAMNKLNNIIPVGVALGDSNSKGELTCQGLGSNLLDRQFGQEAKSDNSIKIVRLDDYVKQNNIVPGVIKTDLEGFEMHFLRGALGTIKT